MNRYASGSFVLAARQTLTRLTAPLVFRWADLGRR